MSHVRMIRVFSASNFRRLQRLRKFSSGGFAEERRAFQDVVEELGFGDGAGVKCGGWAERHVGRSGSRSGRSGDGSRSGIRQPCRGVSGADRSGTQSAQSGSRAGRSGSHAARSGSRGSRSGSRASPGGSGSFRGMRAFSWAGKWGI